jgi:thermolabile hemolysin
MKSQTIQACRMHALLRGVAVVAGLAMTLGSAVSVVACDDESHGGRRTPFTAIYVFGDSWSDTGRADALLDFPAPPVTPYLNGRASNGPLWIEYLSPALGLRYEPENNYAWAGALSGHGAAYHHLHGTVEPEGLPGMLDELAEFVDSLPPGGGADPDALYVVFGGSQDNSRVVHGTATPPVMVADLVRNLVTIVKTLRAKGAEHIVVVDIPDWGTSPGFTANAAATTALCATINAKVNAALTANGLEVIHVSAFALLDDFVSDPGAYGFSNVTTASIPDLGLARHSLFWDNLSLTSRAHRWIAVEMLRVLHEAGLVKPGHGIGHGDCPSFACDPKHH